MSKEQKHYIKKIKMRKKLIILTQLFIIVFITLMWELFARYNLINTFITSYPSRIFFTIVELINNNSIWIHIYVTLKETIIAFIITSTLSLIISVILYRNDFIAKVFDPYLTLLNSLPKVALGPIIIIWIGANTKSIITMAIFISLIVSIQSIYNGFKNTDKNRIKLLKTFKATNTQILLNVIIPSNYSTIFNTLKINISMCLIGVIMGEFLTSKAGIGYLILYGSQVFNLNLVMTGIVLLLFISILLYKIISFLEKRIIK